MLKTIWKECPMCQWIMGSLERRSLKNKCLLCWASVNGDTR